MQNIFVTFGILAVLTMASVADAKVVDPEPVIDGKVMYLSHANYVEAVNMETRETIWKTELYKDSQPNISNRHLEEDVQWNIIRLIEITGANLRAVDGKGREFILNKMTGRSVAVRNSFRKIQNRTSFRRRPESSVFIQNAFGFCPAMRGLLT